MQIFSDHHLIDSPSRISSKLALLQTISRAHPRIISSLNFQSNRLRVRTPKLPHIVYGHNCLFIYLLFRTFEHYFDREGTLTFIRGCFIERRGGPDEKFSSAPRAAAARCRHCRRRHEMSPPSPAAVGKPQPPETFRSSPMISLAIVE